MTQLFANNATSVLASSASAVATSLVLQAGQGARFPAPTGGNHFLLTLVGRDSNGIENAWEIVKVTARATDTLTVVRAQESTVAAIWGVGTPVSARLSAASIAGLVPLDTKDATGGYAGLTLFKINFRNALNTFTSFFTNANTAARTYTFQDRDGTIADMTDVNLKTTASTLAGVGGAALVGNTAAGNIVATTVQAAINELDTEKQAVASKDATGGYAGLTLFKLNLKNAANTFTNFFTSVTTAARTWTMPDKDGTVAMTSDITGTNSGTNTGDQTITLTGDVTGTGTGSFAATVGNNKITLAKMATMATASFLGRNTAATGNVEVLSVATVKTMLGTATDHTTTLNSANAYADGLVVGLWDDRGNYDASTNLFPAAGGSGAAGAVLKGDIWTTSVAGTLGGVPVAARQTIRAMIDAPAQTAANWAIGLANTDIDDSITDGVTGRAPSQNAVFDALALKATLASPTLTGTPAAPTAAPGTNTTQLATTAFVQAFDDAAKANLASPTFTGTPAAPTPALSDNDTSIATTAFVQTVVNGRLVLSVAGGTTTTLTADQAAYGRLAFTGALTANKAVVLPNTEGRWDVANLTTGAYTLTVKTAAGSGVVVTQAARTSLSCDTVNVYETFTDFKDIALFGVSTAPTAAPGTNTTQLATTAFVQAYDDAAKVNLTAKDATGGYAGLTLFKINFKNAANTFTSFFTNANTAARTYTFQNRDGTIADNTDLGLKVTATTLAAAGGAALVGNTPAGNIAATTVQAAINELDTEKAAIGSLNLNSLSTYTVADANAITLNGTYRVSEGFTGSAGLSTALSMYAGTEGVITHTSKFVDSAYAQQTFYSALGPHYAVRDKIGGVWSAWRRAFTQGSILGTVSQVSGVPTGAIIETGTNGNGTYTKFADGTMKCFHKLTGFGALDGNATTVTWTFPAAFSAAPIFTTTAAEIVSPGMHFHSSANPSTTGAQVSKISAAPFAPSNYGSAFCLATGRWF